MKIYLINGSKYQYEEGEQPAGAVELKPREKAAKPANKSVKPANKARKAAQK